MIKIQRDRKRKLPNGQQTTVCSPHTQKYRKKDIYMTSINKIKIDLIHT